MDWMQRRAMLLGQARTFAPADEGGSGGGGEGEGGAAGDGAEGDDQGGVEDQGEGGGSILDMATGDKAKADGEGDGDGDYTPPDFLPEHLRGKDPDETLKKLHEAYAGARKALSKGTGKLEGEVPDSPDGYTFEDTGTDDEPDKVYAELTSEASKPLVTMAQKAAHKMGIPDKAFQGFMREFVAGAEDIGLPVGISDEEAQQISAEAEMERLTEIVGSGAEASTLVNTVKTYAQKLVDRGTISKDDIAEFGTMVGTAESAHLFYRIMTAELGEKPIPAAEGGSGSITATDAYALHAKASAMPDGAEKQAAMEEAQRAMQKAFGQNSSGSVPSAVL